MCNKTLRGESEKKYGKILLSLVGVPAEVRSQHLPNTSLQRCRYTNLLGRMVIVKRQTLLVRTSDVPQK